MKAKITAFIDGLITYDFILFGSIFAIFILLIILGILLRKRKAFAIFIIILAFIVLFIAPIFGYKMMHEFLFKHNLELLSQKRLNFTEAVVVKGKLTNESKLPFNECLITAKAHKQSKKALKNFIYSFKSFQKMSIIEYEIPVGQSRDFKIIVEPFTYAKDYNITLGAKCR